MPYIKQDRRNEVDHIIDDMVKARVDAKGDLNYILYKYCKKHIPVSYNAIKNYIGELRTCAAEIERTILGPYEDMKKDTNGPII